MPGADSTLPVSSSSPETPHSHPQDTHTLSPSLDRDIPLPSCAPQSTPRHPGQRTPATRGTLGTEQPQRGCSLLGEGSGRAAAQPARPWGPAPSPEHRAVPEQPRRPQPQHRRASLHPLSLLPVRGRSTSAAPAPGQPLCKASARWQVLHPNNCKVWLSSLPCLPGSCAGKASAPAPVNAEWQRGHSSSLAPGPAAPRAAPARKPGLGPHECSVRRGRMFWGCSETRQRR